MNVPTYFLIAVFAGWLNRQQQSVIEYLKAENEILKSQLRGRRPRLTDGERRRATTPRTQSVRHTTSGTTIHGGVARRMDQLRARHACPAALAAGPDARPECERQGLATRGLGQYKRPPYPSTWVRMHESITSRAWSCRSLRSGSLQRI